MCSLPLSWHKCQQGKSSLLVAYWWSSSVGLKVKYIKIYVQPSPFLEKPKEAMANGLGDYSVSGRSVHRATLGIIITNRVTKAKRHIRTDVQGSSVRKTQGQMRRRGSCEHGTWD